MTNEQVRQATQAQVTLGQKIGEHLQARAGESNPPVRWEWAEWAVESQSAFDDGVLVFADGRRSELVTPAQLPDTMPQPQG